MAQETNFPLVDGVMGLQGDGGGSWLAIAMDLPEGFALEGFLWYNNDQLVVFPSVAVGTGHESGPGLLEEMIVVNEQVTGSSSAWSTTVFDQPIGASLGRLYLVMEFPASDSFTFEGEGGGPAVGYCAAGLGTSGWISGDGEFWMPLEQESDFAFLPMLVPFDEGMAVKSLDPDEEQDLPPVTRPYLAAFPNPFNPVAKIRFGLTRPGEVQLDIYDIRGARIARLIDESMDAGHHMVPWSGTDHTGRRVASGTYVARMVSGDVSFNQKLMLIK